MSGHPSAGSAVDVRPVRLRRRLVFAAALLDIVVLALPAAADIIPADRRTTWNPGLSAVGGIPFRTTVYRTLAPSGGDDTAAIQGALDSCPANQVVQLGPGTFHVSGDGLEIRRSNVTLRGAGATRTRLVKAAGTNMPVVIIGQRWYQWTQPASFTADAVKETSTVTLASNPGLAVGELIHVDETYDSSLIYYNPETQNGDYQGWGEGRQGPQAQSRPIGQAMEIASISGNTVTFTTPFHITFRTSHAAHLARISDGSSVVPTVKGSGIEDLYVAGGEGDGNLIVYAAQYCWVRNVESDRSNGSSIAFDGTFRCELRDSYVHSTVNPSPGGGGYGIVVDTYAADNLVENNISWNFNKVMVMRSSGGGNVIGYNYMEDGYGDGYPTIVEVGLNASHMAGSHYELFEGNQAFNYDSDSYWGSQIYMTVFRNHLTTLRRSLAGVATPLTDAHNRRGIGLTINQWWHNFVGNVIGYPGAYLQYPTPFSPLVQGSVFAYEWLGGPFGDDGGYTPIWQLGYDGSNWLTTQDALVQARTLRDGNYDYFTQSVRWHGIGGTGAGTTPNPVPSIAPSLYLSSKPAFFGSNPWPWVDPLGTTRLYTLPARARFDAGTPNLDTVLTVTRAGTGSGAVSSTPAGIQCGTTCAATFAAGTVVTLTPTPDTGSTFSGWSGACTGTAACQVTVNAPTAVVATFTSTAVSYAVSVARTGTGSGSITSSPAGIDCGATCTASYLAGTVVTLTAAPAAGSAFGGWSGACSGLGTCALTVSAAASVTASFTTAPVLTVTRAGTGLGSVTSAPAGIDCGATCSASYASGTVVTLTAVPSAESAFSGWSGACSGVGACTVTLAASSSVTATFALGPVSDLLSVVRTGTGSGTVTSSPAAIACGATCSASFLAGTVVTLTATPDSGSVFSGWQGSCTGTGTCRVTLAAASTTVLAAFNPPGLVAAWSFDAGSGTKAADLSLHGNTATLLNGVAWAAGKHGNALSFDGVDDLARVADSASLHLTNAATFEAWVYPTASTRSWRTIMQKEVDAIDFTASGGGSTGAMPTFGGTLNGSCCRFVSGPAVLPVNTWTHVAGTYDGARLRMYINGALVASLAATGSFQVNGNPLWIGGNAVYGEYFAGKLDDLRIYGRPLSQAEIQRDMATAVR